MAKKVKRPYIPIYVGDWEKDTNTLSLEAEGALLKLVFKLWDSPTKGLLTICYDSLQILLKKPPVETLKILGELESNKILEISKTLPNTYQISNRRMLREAAISNKRRETGSLGGLAKQKNREAKGLQSAEYDINSNSSNSNNLVEGMQREKVVFSITDLKKYFAESLQWRETICQNNKLTPEQLANRFDEFCREQETKQESYQNRKAATVHFGNWLNQKIRMKKSTKTDWKDPATVFVPQGRKFGKL